MWIHNKVAEVLMMVDTQPKHAFHSWVHKIPQSGYVANVITYQPFKASTPVKYCTTALTINIAVYYATQLMQNHLNVASLTIIAYT